MSNVDFVEKKHRSMIKCLNIGVPHFFPVQKVRPLERGEERVFEVTEEGARRAMVKITRTGELRVELRLTLNAQGQPWCGPVNHCTSDWGPVGLPATLYLITGPPKSRERLGGDGWGERAVLRVLVRGPHHREATT